MLLPFLPSSSFSKSCWNTYLLGELAEHKGESIYQVISEKSQYIFVGEALWVKNTTTQEKGAEEYLFSVQAKFRITKNIKGDLESEILVDSGSVANYGCGYSFEQGVEYLVITNRFKKRVVTYYCEFIRPKDRSMLEEFIRFNDEIYPRT